MLYLIRMNNEMIDIRTLPFLKYHDFLWNETLYLLNTTRESLYKAFSQQFHIFHVKAFRCMATTN